MGSPGSASASGGMARSCFILLFGLGLTATKLTGETDIHVNEGRDWDIITINKAAGLNLIEGDIEEGVLRNSRIGNQYRWPTTVPYYLDKSLEMNAKGVILKAFDQYRLKTCINFAPWRGEANYISVFKGSGCFSSVGNQRIGKQRLSIGRNCDLLGIVEHEFLHALGFWHEQSRSDRDDYVDIIWKNIKRGEEHNFQSYNDTLSSALGVPYDFDSVMHYGRTDFSVGSGPTIVTKNPYFAERIGQRIGLSASDIIKFNRLYNCTTSLTFVDSCDFEEESICGMIQGSGLLKWVRRRFVIGGPQTDFTNMGECKGKGYFMHFSTAAAKPGDHAILKSRILYPKPGPQCLQFFLYNTGAANDVLNIWVQEYDKMNPNGSLQFFKRISGGVTGSWELHNVDINVTKKARVIFEGVRGKSGSAGGFSLDDINLSSTKCPHHIWHIHNITKLLATTPVGELVYSPRFLSPTGYSFQVSVQPNGNTDTPGYMAAYVHLTSGPNDSKLKWPCPWHQATMVLMDQQSDIRDQMNLHHMITTDPDQRLSNGTKFLWDNPCKVGYKVTNPDGSSYYRGPGYGTRTFISQTTLKSRNFIKGDDAFFLFSLEDISGLLLPQPLPQYPRVHGDVDAADQEFVPHDNAKIQKVVIVLMVFVAAGILVMYVLTLVNVRMEKKLKSDKEPIIQHKTEFMTV